MDEPTTIPNLERLKDSETRHRLLIQSWAQAEWETDAEGVVVADSPSWRAYTGQTLEEWLGYGWLDAIHPDDRAYAEGQWRDAMAARSLVNAEFRLRAPGGGWRWTNVRAAPVLDAGGDIVKWVGMNIDIDDRKRAEAALRRSEELRRLAVDGGGMGTWRWNLRNERIWGDATFLELWGVPATDEPLRLSDFTERMSPQGQAEMGEMVTRAIAAGEEFDGQLAVVRGPTSGRWVRWRGRAERERPWIINGVSFDVTAQRLADHRLRQREERHAFLLGLSDGLRPIADPVEIQRVAARMLGKHLKASRVFYVNVGEDGETADILGDYSDGVGSRVGRYALSGFSSSGLAEWRAGRNASTSDVDADPRYSEAERRAYAAVSTRAGFGIPLIKEGRLQAILGVDQSSPRCWTDEEIGLAEEVAERTWAAVERARAEAALRDSEERFAQFAASSSDALWIRDAATLAMEYVSPAIQAIYGVPQDALLGDPKRWAALIVPEDRDTALEHIEQARRGEAVVHEFRIQRPSDGAFRWIRNTDFPLRDNGHVSRIGGIAQDVTEAKLATEHQGVLLAELQHRVRNIMAVIRAITARTGERAESVPDYAAAMAGRLLTLARVQALLTRAANVGVGIKDIVRDELASQAQHEGQYDLEGPDVVLSPKAAEVLTLATHELTTNALKYGGLSTPEGRVTVRWATFERRGTPWLRLDWTEEGAPERAPPDPSVPRRRGFGSELIEGRVPYELGGRGKVVIEPGGARCHLEFPLKHGDSILETDAPRRAGVRRIHRHGGPSRPERASHPGPGG